MLKIITLRISLCITILVSVLIVFLYKFDVPFKKDNSLITITFIIIGALSIYNLFKNNALDGISLGVVFWFFNLIFFFFTPYLKYLYNLYEFEVSEMAVLKANVMIILYNVLFIFAYRYSTYKINRRTIYLPDRYYNKYYLKLPLRNSIAGIALSYFIFIYFLYEGKLSLQGILGAQEEFGPIQSMIQFYLRPMTFFVFLYCVINVKINKCNRMNRYILLALSIIPAILLNFPLSTNRFYVFSIYLGLLLIIYPPKKNNRTLYLAILFVGIIGSMIVNELVRYQSYSIDYDKIIIYMTGLTFDAYESFVYSIDYVNVNGITWGRQLLGGLLFWIPREIWANKPIGTGGFVVAAYHNATFLNVGSPLIEEGYINFSLTGVVVCSIFLGLLFGYCDVKYKMSLLLLKSNNYCKGIHRYIVFYPISVGYTLFALRGDFMSSFSYFIGILLSFLTISFIVVDYKKSIIIANT